MKCRAVVASALSLLVAIPGQAVEFTDFPTSVDNPVCSTDGPCVLVPRKRLRQFVANQLDDAYARGFNRGRERCGNYTEWSQ